MDSSLPKWLALAICLALAFMLSGMEAGVFALNRLRVRRLARSGDRRARVLHGFLENPEKFLWTILVGNTLANFLVLAWILTRLHECFAGHPSWGILTFAVAVFLFYTLFDLLPKMLFRAYSNQLCLIVADLFCLIHVALSPLVVVLEELSLVLLDWMGGRAFTGRLFGNREEMRAIMQESSGALTSDEYTMINRVLDLQNFTARQIAIPLSQVVTVQTQTSLADALALARERKLSRMPVWETRDGRQCIAGLLAIDPLLFGSLDMQQPVAGHLTPALFLTEDIRLEVALHRMQRAGERLAIVLAHDGSEMGIVSLEDIFKLMFGEVKL